MSIREVFLVAASVTAAYLIGSIPPAYIVSRLLKGIDIRKVGSHNLGAMNVFYSVGFWPGLLVLATDIGKGALAVAFSRIIGAPLLGELAAGFMAVIGHDFPVFLKFRGGKGGATCIGVLAVLLPWGIPFYIALFGLALLFTRYPTLSYGLAFVGFIGASIFLYRSPVLFAFCIVLLAIPVMRYIPRIIEMRVKGGSWGHVVMRKNLKDRL